MFNAWIDLLGFHCKFGGEGWGGFEKKERSK